jgi:TonB family protein
LNKTISSNVIRGIVLAIFSFLAVVPVVSAAVADQDAKAAQKALDTAEAHLKKADEAYAAKKLDIAKDEAKRALKLEKNSPVAHLMLALVYRAQNKPKDALKSIKEAIKYRQNYAYAHYLLAVLLYERNDPKESAKDFTQSAEEIDLAISQGISYAGAFALKGTLMLAAGNFESALEAYKKALQVIAPNDLELQMLQEQITALESYIDFKSHKHAAYKQPKPLNLPMPNYTEEARAKKVQGVVRTRILVTEQGEVKSILLISRLGHGLDREAIRAAMRLKFSPATKDGKPVPYWVGVDIEFNLR